MTSDVVKVGDTMRFSTELLEQIHERPDHRSVLVKVVEIAREADGSKTIWLNSLEQDGTIGLWPKQA